MRGAPELMDNKQEYNQECDMWSLGMLLLEIVSLRTKQHFDYDKRNFG